jgi:Leucine-rich repeat (LRR) protein
MKEIFMHIGNVKELILSGNEISSVQGLDLADISRLAKLPFLMNLDIKGNPLEIAGKT